LLVRGIVLRSLRARGGRAVAEGETMISSRLRRSALGVGVAVLASFVASTSVRAAPSVDSSALRNAVTVNGVRAHQQELQEIANENGGTRVSGSSGFDESADYVVDTLVAAGYSTNSITRQEFTFTFFEELTPAELEQTAPNPFVYTYLTDFFTMEYSGSGNVTAAVQAVDLQLGVGNTSTSGCEATDFDGFTPGNIALIQRGTCNFSVKAVNAEDAGAAGVIIFNQGNTATPDRLDLFGGTLGGQVVTIPVVSAPYARGEEWNGLIDDGLTMRLEANTFMEDRTTENVILETGGRSDRVVVVGAHLDSVAEGPGINDNGSGTATILEIAEQIKALNIQPRNQIRFMWYGAEEAGLIGSEFYVAGLSTRQIKDIAVMLNFDMVGSPNFVRFVYDGDGSGTGTVGPNGSDVVEDVFLDYFTAQSLPTEPTAFDGRSDYGPFIAVGIPAGGLFSGAEGIKTAAQATTYGGAAGVAYDPCYHQACDTFANNSNTVLDEFADAAAHATLTFAMTTSAVNGTDKGKARGQFPADFEGSHLQR
jgi:Zn-dependent M28 family amino/carboxypeptidase